MDLPQLLFRLFDEALASFNGGQTSQFPYFHSL